MTINDHEKHIQLMFLRNVEIIIETSDKPPDVHFRSKERLEIILHV